MKEEMKEETKEEMKKEMKECTKIAVLKIRMMTDDEWNRLAYRNYLERRGREDVTWSESEG